MIDYSLKRSSRARRLRITIYPGGRCVVTVPKHAPQRFVEMFLAERSDWITQKIAYFKKRPGKILAGMGKVDFIKHKSVALALAKKRLLHFNTTYGYTYKRIAIRNQTSRWGSCSKTGNLNFNYKLALLPPALADYLIVHELCHLGEFNHSKKFWQLVAKTIPEYSKLRKELKKY